MTPSTPLVLCAKRIAVGTGTVTQAGVDIRDFVGELRIAVGHTEVSTSGATTIVYSILDSADNTTFAASAGLPAAQTTTHSYLGITVDPITWDLDVKTAKRYIALKALTASATATFDVAAIAVGIKNQT